jgi:hypothetical protein
MKLTHVIAVLALAAGLTACKKKEETKTETPAASGEGTPKTTETPAAKGRSIPNANGLVVEAPAKWLDNGIGGAAGMHLDADGGMFMINETSPEEAAKGMAGWKKDTEEMLFQKWITAEELPDNGFKALYAIDKIKMKGEEPVKDGTQFAFHTRRKIGDKVRDCYGSAATQADAQEGLDLCLKVAAK